LKRIFLLLVLFFTFITSGVVAQDLLQHEDFSFGEDPQPLSTTTDTCIVGTDTLIFTVSTTEPLCNGDCNGTATVTVNQGTPPYTYLWSNGQTTSIATGYCTGTKNIEVWDTFNDCVFFFTIGEPGALAIVISPPAPITSCNGFCDGAATANVSGGTPPFTYSWAPSGCTTSACTGLCAGSNTVSVTDANACTTKKIFVIGQPLPLVANGSSTTINCFGNCNGSACVAPTGGNPPYTYSWSNGATTSCITGLCAPLSLTCTVTDTKTCTATYTTSITQPTALTVTVTGTNLLCNSVCTGSVTATASGGVMPYTYSWMPGGCADDTCANLCAGNYTLTLTDANGCVLTNTIAITQPAALTVTVTGTNINCFGFCTGTATANAGGGTVPYTYSWSTVPVQTTPSATGLCAGTYTVDVWDANGCTASGTVTITEPPLLTVTATATNVTCNGFCNGSVTATASGGTPAYTYAWSPGGCTTSACAGLCAQNYTITVTDSKGCTATATVAITEPLPLLPNLSMTPATCNGICDGTVTSSPTGGTPPYTYDWDPGNYTTAAVSGLCTGTYTLNLTDANGCTNTATITVTQPGTLSASISSATPNPLNCNGDCNGTAVVSVLGGTAPYSYLWNTGPTATSASITGLCAGSYSVTVTDFNGCTTSASVFFIQPTPLIVIVNATDPTCNGATNGSLCAIAGGGSPGYTFSWQPGSQTTSCIAGLGAGIYTLTVTDSKGCTFTSIDTLAEPLPLTANTVVVDSVSCAGQCDGSATSSPFGGTSPYTFLWTGGQTTSAATGLCAGSVTVTVTDANGCTVIDVINIIQPTVLSSSIGSTTSSCTLCTGTATVSTLGGTSPYTFLWCDGQTTSAAVGLCIGTCSVTVTDANGCTNTLTATIPPVVTLTVTVNGTSVSCAGSCDGIATATPSGGGAPYNYQWCCPIQTTQTATGLCAGTYTVTVSDINGCITTNTVTFTDPPPLASTMSATVASCGICNGTATSTPSGGTGAYAYDWNIFPNQTTATATGLCAGNYSVTVTDMMNCTITNTVTVGNISVITANQSVTDANCGLSDGSICLAPTGGTSPYTYTWAPGGETTSCITAIPSGIYTVTITDAVLCSATFPIAVSNISTLSVTVTSAINPVCNSDCNGSISVSVSGGTLPYTFLWSPGGETTSSITGLCAGTYIFQVIDAVPCTSFVTIILTDPLPFVPNPLITNVSCNGGNNGSICLSPTGGVNPYTFAWSNGQSTSCATGLIAGCYTVIITDATGCDDTIPICVTEPSALSVTIASTNVTCNGNNDGTATATVTGGTTIYTYLWMPGGSPLPTIVGLSAGTTYTITVTDGNGCTATASVLITEPAVLTTTITSTNITCNSLCDGTATLTVAGGTTAYTYSWSNGDTTATADSLCVGNYQGTVTDANGCTSTQSVNITEPAALSVTVTFTNASCSGGCDGTASASVSGGSGAYTYLWNPGGLTTSSVTGLCTGSYTLDVSDANGCVTNSFFSIAAPAVLQPGITNTSPLCFGGCDGTATSSPVGGTPPYTFLWCNGQTTGTATGLCVGTCTLTLSDANGCAITQTTTIVAPTPLTQANGVAPATCMLCNGSITIIASGGTLPYTYSWFPNTTDTTPTITGLCSGVYIDTVMDANGCISIDTIGVSNTSGPALTFSVTTVTCNSFCDGTATTIETGDGPPWIYSWLPTNQTTQTATGLCANQSPFFVTVTDTNGCVTVADTNISEPPQIVANPIVTNATCFSMCDGNITTSATGGTGALTYSWFPGMQTTTSITGQCSGNYTLTITDANGCVLTTTFTIGENSILTSTVTSTNDSCNGSCDGTATVVVSGGTLPYTYAWTGGQTTSTATGLCAGTFTITVTDAIGCIHSNSVIITEPASLVSNISGVNPLCNGDCNGSVSSAPTGGTPPYTYLWSNGCATSACTGLCAGTYTLTLTDANNCLVTATVTLTAPAPITLTDVVTNANCTNTCDGSIDITPSGGTIPYTFLWSNAMTTEDVSGLCAGIYSVTITDANGCSFTDSMTVGVITLVIADAGINQSFCAGGTATLCSNSINADSIQWYQLPGWTFIGNTNCINQNPPVGVTSFALIAFNLPCSDTDTVNVTVNAYPVLVSSNDTTICQGDSVLVCSSGAGIFMWYQLPLWIPVDTAACIMVSPALGTTCYGIIGMNGFCTDTDTVCVTVLAMPVAVAGNDTAFCFGDSIVLCSNSLNATSLAWYSIFPAWTPINTTACITVIPPVGNNDFALIASSGICSDTDTVAVTIYPLPTADAGTSVTILSTASTGLSGTGNGTYMWSPATGLSCTTCANPTANPTVTTTYTLSVTDINGCMSSDSVRVTIITDVIVNDGLSPNGDGINDVWEIANIEQFPDALVEVYNRWGELLFSSIGYKEKWNCKYNNNDLPVGTYYYVINLNSDLHKEPLTGPITILR